MASSLPPSLSYKDSCIMFLESNFTQPHAINKHSLMHVYNHKDTIDDNIGSRNRSLQRKNPGFPKAFASFIAAPTPYT